MRVVLVGLPGFEPRMTGPESVVLPLHHSPIASAKVAHFFSFSKFFHKKVIRESSGSQFRLNIKISC